MSSERQDFYTNIGSLIFNDITYERANYFYFLGRINQWSDTSYDPDDSPIPDSPLIEYPPATIPQTVEADRRIRDNILLLRKIVASDVSIVTRRINWESGKYFTQWDHTKEMETLDFYCVTDEYKVYKCLHNNFGGPSTVKPTGDLVYPFSTSDGYLWKYMYTIIPTKREQFLTADYLPVQKALYESFYSKGAIEEIVIHDGGTGYEPDQATSITVSSDTTVGYGAEAYISEVGLDGEILEITLVDNEWGSPYDSPLPIPESPETLGNEYTGTGYTKGVKVEISNSPTGLGANLEAEITEDGRITYIKIHDGGIGYSLSDIVTFSVGGANLIPIISQEDGSVLDVIIKDGGIGYDTAPTLTLSPLTGEGIYGNSEAVLKAFVHEGTIVNVTIEDPGTGYDATYNTSITIDGDGTGAAVTPVIDEDTGAIIDVIIDDEGYNYTYANLTIIGSGINADLRPAFGPSSIENFNTKQSLVEQTAVPGAIYAIEVTEGGNNYSANTTVTIEGDGTGAEAYAVLTADNISKIVVTSYGEGYSYANVIIEDSNRINNPLFVDAEAYVILPPISGHGFDAVSELYGKKTCIYTNLYDNSEIQFTAQDFRQFGILKNPTNLLTNLKSTTQENLVQFETVFNTVTDLELDDILINNNVRYRVISIDSINKYVNLQQLSTIYTTPIGQFIKEDDNSVTFQLTDLISVPEVNKYSGELYYVSNVEPFFIETDETIVFRTYFSVT